MSDIDFNSPMAQAFMTEGQARGYSAPQIAAVLGNSQQENGLSPGGNPGDSGISHGAMQWNGDRFGALQQAAKAQGTTWDDPSLQAKFYFNELDGPEKKAGDQLRAAQDPYAANTAVVNSLRPEGWDPKDATGASAFGKRLANTRAALTAYQSIDPNAPAPGAAPASGQGQPGPSGYAVPGQNQGQPQSFWDKVKSGGPGALLGMPDNGVRPWDLGSALTNMGIAAMARDNPQGAAAMAQVPSMEARAYMPRFQTSNYQPETGRAIVTDQRTGQVTQGQVGQPFQKMPEQEWNNFGARNTDINGLQYTYDKLSDIRNQLASGQLDLSGISRVKGMIDNGLNISDPNDQKIANYIHQLGLVHSADMSMQKGTQTDADADNMMKALIPEGAGTDNAQVLQSLDNVLAKRRTALQSNIQLQKGTVGKYGTANGSQLPNGPWYDPNYYDSIGKKWDDQDAAFAPQRQAFLAKRAAAQGASSGDTGQPMPKPSASPKSGSTENTGGSLANGGNPIAPGDVAKLPAGVRFRGVDGKVYRSVGPAQSDQSNGALPPGLAPAI